MYVVYIGKCESADDLRDIVRSGTFPAKRKHNITYDDNIIIIIRSARCYCTRAVLRTSNKIIIYCIIHYACYCIVMYTWHNNMVGRNFVCSEWNGKIAFIRLDILFFFSRMNTDFAVCEFYEKNNHVTHCRIAQPI